MAFEQKLFKCDPADPNRCQGRGDGGEGQCCFLAVEGTQYCPKHGAGIQLARQEKKRVSLYRLQQWQARVDEFSAHEQTISLRDEIGIIRLQIENIFSMCHDQQDLMMYSTRISDLVMKAERLVNSCAKLESRSSNLLDKGAALILAGQIVDLVGSVIAKLPVSEDVVSRSVDEISGGLIDLVAKLAGKEIEDE